MIITNEKRARLTNAVLEHAFAERLSVFLACEPPLILSLYMRAYPADERKAMQLLNERHRGSMSSRLSAVVNAGGQKIIVGSGGRNGRGPMDSILPDVEWEYPVILVVDAHQYSDPMLSLPAEDDLAKRVQAHAAKQASINEEIKTRRVEISGVLADIRTDGQLRERWPEVMPIAESILKIEPKPQVPMVPLDTLNTALGLPVTEEPTHGS